MVCFFHDDPCIYNFDEITICFQFAEEGKKVIFKTENLNCLEFLQEFNKIVVPLVPKEEESTGKIAGKLSAAGGKLAAKGPAQKQGKRKA